MRILRSARAPLPKFWNTRLRWPAFPVERPYLSHRAGAPQPPRPCLLLTPDGLCFIFYGRLLSAWTEALVAIPGRESEGRTLQLRRAWSERVGLDDRLGPRATLSGCSLPVPGRSVGRSVRELGRHWLSRWTLNYDDTALGYSA
eukprot:553272-Pleurochrysis_carterae.AAC.1